MPKTFDDFMNEELAITRAGLSALNRLADLALAGELRQAFMLLAILPTPELIDDAQACLRAKAVFAKRAVGGDEALTEEDRGALRIFTRAVAVQMMGRDALPLYLEEQIGDAEVLDFYIEEAITGAMKGVEIAVYGMAKPKLTVVED